MADKIKIQHLIKESWSVSWPMTLIMVFIFLMGLADVYVAGYFGKEIKAAYGLSYQLYFIFLIAGMTYSVGLVSIISRLFTSENKEDINKCIYSSLAALVIIGGVIEILALTVGDTIIEWLRLPGPIKKHAITFIRLYSLGIVFHYLLINTNAVLRASKMIKTSLLTMSIVCIINIVCNFLFSFHTPLAFRGIALSTALSLCLGSVVNMYFVFKRILRTNLEYSFSIVKKVLSVAWPIGCLHILWQLGSLVLFLILGRLPRYSIETMAAFTNGLRVEAAIFLPAFAFNMANAVIIGNLLGEKREEDAFRAGLTNTVMGVILVTVITIIAMANTRYIAQMISQNNVVMSESVRYMFVAFLFEPVMAWGVILAGGLNGSGDTKAVMIIIALSIWLVRVPLSFILGILFGYGAIAIWWSMNFSILVQSIFLSKRYFSRHWVYFSREPVMPLTVGILIGTVLANPL